MKNLFVALMICLSAISRIFAGDGTLGSWDFSSDIEGISGRVLDKSDAPFMHGVLRGHGSTPTIIDFEKGKGLRLDAPSSHWAELDGSKVDLTFKDGLAISSVVIVSADAPAGVCTILSDSNVKEKRWGFSLHLYNGRPQLAISDDGAVVETVQAGIVLEPGKVYKIDALFLPGNRLSISVDGKSVQKKTAIRALFSGTGGPIAMGARFWGETPINFFHGVIGPTRLGLAPAQPAAATIKNTAVKVNWDLAGAEGQDNGLRGEYVLNGVWRWQPYLADQRAPDPSQWLFRNLPAFGSDFFVKDAAGKVINSLGGKPLTGEEICWVEREFTVPAEWRGRRIWININDVEGETEAFVDGKSVGWVWPRMMETLPLPADVAGRQIRLTFRTKGIIDDIWLRSAPSGPSLEDPYLTTTWQDKKMRLQVAGRGATDAAAHVQLEIAENSTFEKTIWNRQDPARFKPSANGWMLTSEADWPADVKMWDVHTPQLYFYRVTLLAADGSVLDRSLPQRFGFRDFRIAGGDFILNGHPIILNGNENTSINNGLKQISIRNYESYKYLIQAYQKLSLNNLGTWHGPADWDPFLRAADELGMTVYLQLPKTHEYRDLMGDAQVRGYTEDRIRAFVRRYRQHPSLIMWVSASVANMLDYCPITAGDTISESELVRTYPELVARLDEANTMKRIAAEVDAARPMFNFSGGHTGAVHSTMLYLGFDVELQERENWAWAWNKTRPRPVLAEEMGFPMYASWFNRDSRGSYPRPHNVMMSVEYSAMYFGDRFYREESDADIQAHRTLFSSAAWYQPTPSREALETLFLRNTIRSWRTYGISWAPHAVLRHYFEDKGMVPLSVIAQRDPRTTGVSPDKITHYELVGTKLNARGAAYAEASAPVYAYIGGADGNFTLKDHAYSSGETVRKAAVILNEREIPIQASGSWRFVDSRGNSAASGRFSGEIKPGQRVMDRFAIEFKVPIVSTRESFKLQLSVETGIAGTLKDEFVMEVFPSLSPAEHVGSAIVFDPSGESGAVIRGAGIEAKAYVSGQKFSGQDFLIIGRRAFSSPENVSLLRSAGFDDALRAGMKVVIFEQSVDNLMGLKMEPLIGPRHVFISAAGHPVLAGLRPEDFHYWRGDSDLTQAHATLAQWPHAYPERFWKWGNDNIVATCTLYRPQSGACRAILASGFDMQETPLLETVVGQGRILFCQLDVTNRYGKDPVATRLANNLLAYAARVAAPQAGENVLADVSGDSSLTRQDILRLQPGESTLEWGITASDLYFKEPVTLPVLKGKSLPLYAVAKTDRGDVVQHTLNLKMLKTQWQRAKALRALAALRINAGGTSSVGPMLALTGDTVTLYPVIWLEGMVDPYLYWRW